MVAQEQGPLAAFGNGRRQLQNVGDGIAVFHAQRHEQPWHQREMKGHMTLVALAEVSDRVFRPLVGLRQQHAVMVFLVNMLAQFAQRLMSFRQVFAIGAFALKQVRDSVEPQAIDAQIKPEIHGREHGLADLRVVPVQVRLMRVEAVPVVCLGNRVPGPVGTFEVFEDDASVTILLRGVAPHVVVAPVAAGQRPASALKPRMLV